MNKIGKLILFLAVVSFMVISSSLYAERVIHDKDYVFKTNKDKGFTPVKFCVCPYLGSWPSDIPVIGLNLGLVNFGSDGVTGLDLSLVNDTKYLRGFQLSLYNDAYYVEGGQTALYNYAHHVMGLQIGVVNQTNYFNGALQLAIVNYTKDSKNIQIGLWNIMDNGFLKHFPIFNFPKNWL